MKKKLLAVSLLVCLLPAILTPAIVLAAAATLFDHLDSGATTSYLVDEERWLCTFNATASYTVSAVDVSIRRSGTANPGVSFWVILKEPGGGVSGNWTAGGTNLFADSHVFVDLPTTNTWLRSYPYDTGQIELTEGNEYGIEVYFPAGSEPEAGIYWQIDGDSDLGYGSWIRADKDAGDWVEGPATTDFYFRIYGSDGAPVYSVGQETFVSDNESANDYYNYCDTDTGKYYSWIDSQWVWTGACGGDGTGYTPGSGELVKDTVEESIDNVMQLWGFDSEGGKMLASIIFILGSWIYFTKPEWFGARYKRNSQTYKILSFIVPAVLFGFFLVLDWIPLWLVVVAGLMVALGLLPKINQGIGRIRGR